MDEKWEMIQQSTGRKFWQCHADAVPFSNYTGKGRKIECTSPGQAAEEKVAER